MGFLEQVRTSCGPQSLSKRRMPGLGVCGSSGASKTPLSGPLGRIVPSGGNEGRPATHLHEGHGLYLLDDGTRSRGKREQVRTSCGPQSLSKRRMPGLGVCGSSTPPSSPQRLETRSRKRSRTHSASSPSADSNGSLGATVGAQRATSRITTDYRGGTASAYKTWLQGIDPQTKGKPAYASYIGVKVAQQLETGWGVGVVCCITADPHCLWSGDRCLEDSTHPTGSTPGS
jgi:hypothetical protein